MVLSHLYFLNPPKSLCHPSHAQLVLTVDISLISMVFGMRPVVLKRAGRPSERRIQQFSRCSLHGNRAASSPALYKGAIPADPSC